MTGYCSNCHKVWTLEERQGVCRWCGQPASCQTTTTKPRQLKSSRSRKRRQVDNGNNGYDQLPEPYLTYYKVGLRFTHKALIDDRQDLLHDIIEGLARVAEYKTLSEAAMYRIAEHIKDHYWYRHYAYQNGLDCQHCSKAQRAKCRANWAYSDWAYCDCYRAITLESINHNTHVLGTHVGNVKRHNISVTMGKTGSKYILLFEYLNFNLRRVQEIQIGLLSHLVHELIKHGGSGQTSTDYGKIKDHFV